MSYTDVTLCGAISGWTGLGWISSIEHITMLIMAVFSLFRSVCLDDFKTEVASTNRISQPIPRYYLKAFMVEMIDKDF